MTREELELKAKEFDSKLKRHPMSSEELQKVLCDFVEALPIHDVVKSLPKERPNTTSTFYPIKEKNCFWCGNKR